MGEFAGTTEPGAPVGEFAGPPRRRVRPKANSPGGQKRGGSFADTERDLLMSYPEGVERMRVTGHRGRSRLLTDAGLDEATAKRDVDALHQGLTLLLVELPEEHVDRVVVVLEG